MIPSIVVYTICMLSFSFSAVLIGYRVTMRIWAAISVRGFFHVVCNGINVSLVLPILTALISFAVMWEINHP